MQLNDESRKLAGKSEHRMGPRIIVVDDDAATLEATAEFIQLWYKDVEVLPFQDAAIAWQELLVKAPDILLTDFYHFPPTGEEMLMDLAKQKAKFPILVISGVAKEEQVRRCAGETLNVSSLRKPWTGHQLYGELSQHLGQGITLQQ
jgi:FixJ family two-component response regulator